VWYLPKSPFLKPCFKKGDKSQVSNYTPISLLTGFSKIFEFLIFRRLKHHLVSNNIDNQNSMLVTAGYDKNCKEG